MSPSLAINLSSRIFHSDRSNTTTRHSLTFTSARRATTITCRRNKTRARSATFTFFHRCAAPTCEIRIFFAPRETRIQASLTIGRCSTRKSSSWTTRGNGFGKGGLCCQVFFAGASSAEKVSGRSRCMGRSGKS